MILVKGIDLIQLKFMTKTINWQKDLSYFNRMLKVPKI